MNFPSEHTKNVFNFPLERSDKVPEYIEDLKRKISISENNPPFVSFKLI